MRPEDARRAHWWRAVPTCLALLLFADACLRLWSPAPRRLPEQFSATYLARRVAAIGSQRRPLVCLGDSVVWGFKVSEADSLCSLVMERHPDWDVVNFSYEGGSPANSYAVLDYLIARGVHPRAVLVNVNLKTFNPIDSAYRTLHPAVERDVATLLTAEERHDFKLTQNDGSHALARVLEKVWLLYALRADLKEALFGHDDAAQFVTDLAQSATGAKARTVALHRPTPDTFLATYDLSPLGPANLGVKYLVRLRALARSHGIDVVGFLTPTNHALLHDYIDNRDYDRNRAYVAKLLTGEGSVALDEDRAIAAGDFLDNDHLDPAGNRTLEAQLEPTIATVLR